MAAIAGLTLTACGSDSDAPAFDDIEVNMWDAMSSADAMGITGTLPEAMASDAVIIEDMLGANVSDVQIYGSLTEPATAIRLGDDQEPIMYFFDDEVFVSWNMMVEVMTSPMGAEVSEAQLEEMRQNTSEFDGKYIDVSENYASIADSMDMTQLLEQMRSAAESDQPDEITGLNFGDLQQEGAYMQVDMETEDTGWFYSIDGEDENAIMNGQAKQFIGIETDRDAPRLIEARNGESSMDFTWDDDVEVPERPSDDQILTEEDIRAAAVGQ